MSQEIIVLGADHAGFAYKEMVKAWLLEAGYAVEDKGTDSLDSVDYPDFVHPAAEFIEAGRAQRGLLFCGSGNGVAMTANKHQQIRAAIAWTEELSRLARQHNNANMLAVPCRFVSEAVTLSMVKAFLATDFEGGRHARRVGKIASC
ncbi:MAG: RpiB/LacA/LacB family sugar-phosphate isomerase [Bacteroidota bacterium]|mgnify:CR=1 FL=1